MADGVRLQGKIEKMTQLATDLERKFVERLKVLELKLVELETNSRGSHDNAALRWELAQLRVELQQGGAAAQGFQPQVNVANARQAYPATTNWR